MSFKIFMQRHLGDILACVLVIVCVLALVISTIVFWVLCPIVLMIYFWRKYNLWIILGTSLYLFIIASLWGVGNTINETINIAAHLFVLSVVLGATSCAEKASFFGKIRFKKYLVPYVIIAIFVVIIGWYYGALTTSPLGDDAFMHAGKIRFITDNFPNINWCPYWYSGFNMFESYPPTYYFVVGLANVITGVSGTQLMVFFLFFAMFLLGAGVYNFSSRLDLPWYVSALFSLMFLSFPVVWGSTIRGGAYLRSFSLPFYVFSLIVVYQHVSRVNEKSENWKAYILAVFILAFSLLLHLMVGFFVAVAAALIYLLTVKGLKQKILVLFKVFLPVVGLVSWFYLPLIKSYFFMERFGANDLTLGSFEKLFTTSNPVLLPFTLSLVAVFIFMYHKFRPIIRREKISLLTVFLVFTLYFFLCGWLPMPERAYLISSYDCRVWFVFSLALFLITLSSLLYKPSNTGWLNRLRNPFQKNSGNLSLVKVKKNERFIAKSAAATVILMIFSAFIVSLPTIETLNLDPDNPKTFVYWISAAMGQIDDEIPNNFRLTGVGRRLHALHPFKYPQVELALGRQGGSTHAYYDSLFRERVFYRYSEDQLIYLEEQAPIHSGVEYMGDNFFSSMFWLDWFGVNGIVKAEWEGLQTLSEYELKPQYFNITEFAGGSTYIQYIESSPVLVSTNATTVGVLTEEKDGESLYRAVFLTLGELNLNSQWVIPLKLDGGDLEDNLEYIDAILVTSDQYPSHEALLQNYVNAGGNLVIMNYEYNSSELKAAELSDSGLVFYTSASPLTQCEGFEVIGKTEDGTIICRSQVGEGSITHSSISIKELYEEASSVASAVLGTIISPDFELHDNSPQKYTGDVSYRKNALGKVTHLDKERVMEFELMQNVTAQINFSFFLENEASISATGLVQFELWNDGKTNNVALALISSRTSNYLSYTLSNFSWTGWRTFSIPLASFITSSSASLINEFNGIDLVINTSNQSIENNEDSVCMLKVRSLGFYEAVSAFVYEPLDYEWVRPNQLVASLGEGFGGGCLLWKESYVEHWGITADPVVSGVRFYYAGPGLMLLYIPDGVEEFTFTMPLTEIRIAGITISTITLLALPILSLYRKRSP